MMKYLIIILPFLCYSQKSSFQIIKVNDSLHFTNQFELEKTNISAFDIGDEFLVYAADGKLNIYNYISRKWKRKNFSVLNDFEIRIASADHQQVLTKKDINCIKIDNARSKIGFSLRLGLFKEYDINSLKIRSEWNAAGNQVIGFQYSRLKDEYTLFYKFYPDSISMIGNLRIFKRIDIDKNKFFYKESAGVDMLKILTIDFNNDETVYGGIRSDSCLWLWNKNKPNEINNFIKDDQKLRSFSFINTDSIAMLYNNSFVISMIKDYAGSGKIEFKNRKQPILISFIYNKKRSFFIGQTKNSLILFRLNSGSLEIIDEILINSLIFAYKISENGYNIAIDLR